MKEATVVCETTRPRLLSTVLRYPWAQFPAEDLLNHFRFRRTVHYFPLCRGKAKHVIRAQRILRNEFELNNEVHRLAADFDWCVNPSHDLEWLILLHKFYYLRDLALAFDYTGDTCYSTKWVALTRSWIARVPVDFIDSQVTGRRLQQWILAYQYFVPERCCAPVAAGFLAEFLESLSAQATYLCSNLTPAGNHRTLELYALFLVGTLFPELAVADNCLRIATREMLRNMQADLLPDGVQRELSTDYHHTVLKNYLRFRELAALNGHALDAEVDVLLRRAFDFSVHIHKPDGTIPALNDGDVNSYLSLMKRAGNFFDAPELLYVSSGGTSGLPPAQRSRLFAASGYAVLRSDWNMQPYREARYLCFDCGPLGAGSHGHYDVLNIEYAAYGHSLIIDPGRYTYSEVSPEGVNWRHYFKGTAAHNTVVVDGLDQTPYQCEAPVGTHAQGQCEEFVTGAGFDFVRGHVVSPSYGAKHARTVLFLPDDYAVIVDTLQAPHKHCYEQYFHLAPQAWQQVAVARHATHTAVVAPHLLLLQANRAGQRVDVERGFVSPEYGIKEPAPLIRFTQTGMANTRFVSVLCPYRETMPEWGLRELTVQVTPSCGVHGATLALRMTLDAENLALTDDIFFGESPADLVRFADIEVRARLLWLRRSAQGEVQALHAIDLSYLRAGTVTWIPYGSSLTLSSRGQHVNIEAPATVSMQIPLCQLDRVRKLCEGRPV